MNQWSIFMEDSAFNKIKFHHLLLFQECCRWDGCRLRASPTASSLPPPTSGVSVFSFTKWSPSAASPSRECQTTRCWTWSSPGTPSVSHRGSNLECEWIVGWQIEALINNLSCYFRSTLLQSCWSFSSSRRPTAAEIVELLFNCPRLVSPSIDVPLASVQIER